MAANGQQVFDPVLAAHNTMSSQADRAQKEQAHQYLEQFQKSVRGIGTDGVYMRADMWL
jgi:transportin-3